ncbi:hypothetical protein [Shimia biformata]|uniref:hypothetical protein n=1 Tax=Shimia biformata TaxID=1294299 RepID=UPI0019511A60|nr:hypothetical protein [Shimia biformata]
MIRFLPLTLASATLLAACTEYTPLYKPGVSVQQKTADEAQCNAYGANTVPVWMVTERWPIYGAGGQIVSYTVDVYDSNAGRRQQVINQCMAERGYQRVAIPYCKDEQLAGRSYGFETRLPDPGPNICAVRGKGGSAGIVDLSKTKPAG